ncbi:MAG: helix-turn-helix domain-containing protein [Ilumatobacteraceae bacterium]
MNNRQDVIDAAIGLIRESGPAALTSGNVAARLGITQPAVYRHIDDMDELTTVASQAIVDELGQIMHDAVNAPETTWGEGTHFTQFAHRVVELMESTRHGFAVVDRWRFDDGELGVGIRNLLDLGSEMISAVLEDQWRHNVDHEQPFDDETKAIQMGHARVFLDDIIAVARVVRASPCPDVERNAVRLLSLRVFAGWYAYVHDMAHRFGVPAPELDGDMLRVPTLDPL